MEQREEYQEPVVESFDEDEFKSDEVEALCT